MKIDWTSFIIGLVVVGFFILSYLGYIPFGFIPPGPYEPGDIVDFDSNELINCGLCDMTRYRPEFDGWVVQVMNSAGNVVKEEYIYNVLGFECGKYANVYYPYTVPQGAMEGNWKIQLKGAISPVWPPDPECVVYEDEASFMVGTTCANKDILVQYCVDEDTLYFKPPYSCQVTYTTCSHQGQGYRCWNNACSFVEVCGDGYCDELENVYNCYTDCGYCGDNICSLPYETIENCPADCSGCGDGRCDLREEGSCPQDCASKLCGDGMCWPDYEKSGTYYCAVDCAPQLCTVETQETDCDDDNPNTEDLCIYDIFILGWRCENKMLCGELNARCGGIIDLPCCEGLICEGETIVGGGGTCQQKTPELPWDIIFASLAAALTFLISGGVSIKKSDEVGMATAIIFAIFAFITTWWIVNNWVSIAVSLGIAAILGAAGLYFFGGVLIVIFAVLATLIKSIKGE